MATKKNIVFIMNPISGTVKKAGIPRLVEKYLDKDKFSYTIQCTQYAGHATKIAEKAKDEHADIVVAIGGDGTINEVGRALIQSDTAMGIIPCGSGNGLARHLMLPMDTKKAIKVINEGEIHKLDYGLIDGHPFFCTCGMGFDAYISMKFAQAGKRGPVTYLENILKEGVKYEPERYCVKSDEYNTEQRAFLISCANASQYGNNAYIAPQASMSDGLLDVIIMDPFDMLDAPQISIDMFNKTLNKNTKIKTFKSKHLDIQREKPGYIHYDGDPIMAPANITIHVVSKGINIIVNPFADKTKRQPNVVQNAFCEIFNDLSAVRTDISKQTRHIQSINNYLLKKLNK
ncbi:diacylglycerol/lipid kinase family protein [Prevotella sp.]|uniref:diacylglycerol/lipid kinase family protein n=1 Tax=Prevotella sp. TaxID=59823 RepID=UPI0030789FBD